MERLSATQKYELLQKLNEIESDVSELGGYPGLPTGFMNLLDEIRGKLEDTKPSFPKVDSMNLKSLFKISCGLLTLNDEKRQEIEDLGLAEPKGFVSMDSTQLLIRSVRDHVATVKDAGRRILIDTLLLRVVSVMCSGETTVNVIPDFLLPRMPFKSDSELYTFGGVIPFLVTKIPAKWTETVLAEIGGSVTSSIFVHDGIQTALPQAAIATASFCQWRNIPMMRGAITSGDQWVFFVYQKRTDGTGLVQSSLQYNLGRNLENLPLVLGLLQDCIENSMSPESPFFRASLYELPPM